MDESTFLSLADDTLDTLAEMLETADSQGNIELEYNNGVLTVTLEHGRQLVINRHMPSRQIWLASATQGGLHFSWDGKTQDWRLPDGRSLKECLQQEVGEYLATG